MKKKDRIEVVSMIGLFGLLVTIIEMYVPFLSKALIHMHFLQPWNFEPYNISFTTQ